MGSNSTKLERDFQKKLIHKLKDKFDGCVVMKNDAGYIQGIPDWTILYNDKWAMLEMKRSEKAKKRPNQEYYVNKMNDMSFARFVYPENEEQVILDLESFFGLGDVNRGDVGSASEVIL